MIFILIGIKIVVLDDGVFFIGSDLDILIEFFILKEEGDKEIVIIE